MGLELGQMLTVEEVAERLRLHPLTVRKMARNGTIPAIKIGRQWRFYAKTLNAWASGANTAEIARVMESSGIGSGQELAADSEVEPEPRRPPKPRPGPSRRKSTEYTGPTLHRPDAPRITDEQMEFDAEL